MEAKENVNSQHDSGREVTLRQCETCERKFDEDLFMLSEWGQCPWCIVKNLDTGNEKTEFVLIEKPRDEKLGLSIVQSFVSEAIDKGFESTQNIMAILAIGLSDTQDIQEKIDALNK